jgi:hypothetical protein
VLGGCSVEGHWHSVALGVGEHVAVMPPQTFGVPPPPQVLGAAQVPQLIVPPQPSEIVPQLIPAGQAVSGVQQGPR